MFRIPLTRRSACAGPEHTDDSSPISKARHPHVRATSKIKPSPFHPLVLADEWVTAWCSPYSDVVDNKLSALVPIHVLERWHGVMANSVTEDARKNYGAVPESLHVPASEPLLALFISEMGAGKVQASTVDSWLSGLALWHDVQGAYWYSGRILSRTKQGATAMAPPSTKPPHLPVTEKHIASLRSHLDLNDPFDAAVWAVTTIAWHGCTCLGELLPSRLKPFNTSHNVYRDWISLTSTNDDSDPIHALQNHLKINNDLPLEAPLFAYSLGSSLWDKLSKESFLARCSQIWALDDLDAASGHSFQIVDPWVSSKAFLLYWHKVEEILPLFIGDAMDKFTSIKTTVSHLASL
ncbi:hypothetical protein ARMGADRAFT_1043926 [Armillaria gallica]|uniref:Uncharacterized protein n=1 Tax=Armillaria gallica TaxID=47427 RepID=A0A2H3E9S3_ARMGA|nr:hypothetical protein ARMGADRAFT_1043926 [Armillaria gallica]